MAGVYCGESYAKRWARARMYSHIMELGPPPNGVVVTLTGNDAAEAGIFRRMGWYENACYFVDLNPESAEQARRRMPGSHIITDDMATALKRIEHPIAMIHLDLMGPFNETIRDCMRLCEHRVAPGGFVIWTFLRGREDSRSPWWRLSKRSSGVADRYIVETESPFASTHSLQRFSGYIIQATEALGARTMAFSFRRCVEYNSGKSPMGMFLFQKQRLLSRQGWRGNSVRAIRQTRDAVGVVRIDGDAKAAVRDIAVKNLHWNSDEVSDWLNIPVGTIRAWRAHATMGTYDKKTA